MAKDEAREEAAHAGRGVLLTMAAKVVFIVTGFGVQLALPRLLDAEQWGRYATVGSITSILTNTLVAATVQTVSKRTSEDDARADVTQREGLSIGLGLALLLGGGFALASPLVATWWQHDPTLTPLLATASVVVASYALYSALIGALNGRRQFARQASFDMVFAITRSSGIVGGALVGAAAGAVAGWAGAAVAVLIGALMVVGLGRGGARPDVRSWAAFFVPIAIYQACANGVLQADQPLLRGHVAELALASGQSVEDATQLASRIAGYYRAAQTFAFVPYQLILAVTFIVFPTVSRATSAGDVEATRRAIRGAMRFSLIVVLAMAAPIAGASDGVMRIAYPEEYLAGAAALGVLSIGLVPFALFAIAASILAGAGRARITAVIAATSLVVIVVANRIAVEVAGPRIEATVGAALATSLGALIALIATGAVIRARFGAFLPLVPTLRTCCAGLVGAGVAHFVPHATAIGAIGACIAGAMAYLAALALLRELGEDDLTLVRRVLRR